MSGMTGRMLFGAVMFWTVLTTTFTILPLARIIGRPSEYYWGIMGLRGEGFDGPYWIFILLVAFALTMLFVLQRGPRALAYPMLVLWHLTVTGVVVASVMIDGMDATLQGQGLHFEIPMWMLVVPFVLFTALAIGWTMIDARGPKREVQAWSRTNTTRLGAALTLLAVGLVLFREGNNYNWVTALAIVVTIMHWITLANAFAPVQERRVS